ncbi:proton extrusion protein PcxA [Phormidesmis sp. 146-35]
MTSTLAKLKEYVQASSDRFLNTPDRALNRAYQSVQQIELLETQYFSGDSASIEAYEGHAAAFLKAELEKNLSVARLKLAEFKTSSVIFESLSDSQQEKLSVIDRVLARYTATKVPSSALLPTSATRISTTATFQIEPANTSTARSSVEKTGLLPRSIGNTFNRLKEELNPKSEAEVIKKFRSDQEKTAISVRFLLVLALVPLLTQIVTKQVIVSPIVERVSGGETAQIFINSEMEEEAFRELQSFEESLKFSALIKSSPRLSEAEQEKRVEQKADEIAEQFRQRSKNAISNVFADLIALGAFALILLMSQKEIVVVKSLMDELVYGLSDTTKAFSIILMTDIFVGFHSPHGWEVLLEGMANHLGVAANHSMISLFIATVPVVMDTIFKYWIFRYLSRMSPSTVATLKQMNE